MIHLNPIEYPKLIKRQITLSNKNGNVYDVDITKTNCRLFYGKKLTIVLGTTTYIGRYTYSFINETLKNHLILEGSSLPDNGTYSVYETFVIPEDNQAITFQDLHEKFESTKTPAVVNTVAGINDIGSLNLVDGFQTLKIDQSLYGFKLSKSFTLTENLSAESTFTVRIESNKFNRYHIFLYPTNSNNKTLIDLEFGFNGDCTKYYIKSHSHFEQNSSFEFIKKQFSVIDTTVIDNSLIVTLSKVQYGPEIFATISLKLKKQQSITVNGYIECRHPQDLWIPDEKYSASPSTVLQLNGQNQIEIDQTFLYADKNGEQRTIIWGETLTREIEINANVVTNIVLTKLPKGYYKINRTTAPYGIPGKTNNSSTLTRDLSSHERISQSKLVEYYSNLVWNKATLIVYDDYKYMFITDKKHVFIGTKNTEKDIEWYLLSEYGHTHNTDDLIIGNNKFVTQEQINTWNNTTNLLDNYSWKTYLTKEDGSEDTAKIKSSISSNKGFAAVFLTNILSGKDYKGNPIIYITDNNNNLVPTSIGALSVESQNVKNPQDVGTLIKQATLDKVLGLGIGYRTTSDDTNQQYILINNKTNNYPDKDTNKNKRFFDLVKRTNNTLPGSDSINIGFDNAVSKNTSITLGIGLNSDENKLTLGKWNNPIDFYGNAINNVLIDFGIGTNNTNRKSAFWYTNNLLTINGNIFNNKPDQLEYILVNGSDPILNDFVHYPEFNELKNKVDDVTDNSVFIKLVPLNTIYKPIIRRFLAINDNSEYNVYTIIFKLNNTNGFSEKVSESRDSETNELINIIWKLKSNYSFMVKDIPDEDDEDTSEETIEITSDNFDDDGTLKITNIKKSSIIKIQNSSNNKSFEKNILDYINSLEILDSTITINVTGI